MIKRVFETTLVGGESPMYYCTLCNRPFRALQEANEHGGFCGRDKPIQPTFRKDLRYFQAWVSHNSGNI